MSSRDDRITVMFVGITWIASLFLSTIQGAVFDRQSPKQPVAMELGRTAASTSPWTCVRPV